MSEVVERVARAIHVLRFEDDDGPYDDEREMARVAIEAMREPTEAMLGAHEAVCVFRSQDEREDYRKNLREAWATMINAALEARPNTQATHLRTQSI